MGSERLTIISLVPLQGTRDAPPSKSGQAPTVSPFYGTRVSPLSLNGLAQAVVPVFGTRAAPAAKSGIIINLAPLFVTRFTSLPITYPLTLPSAPTPERLLMKGRSTVALARLPFTGEQQTQEHQGSWWEAEITLPPMEREEAEAWISFLLKLRGMTGTFLLPPYGAKTPQGAPSGTPVVDGAGQSGLALATRGWPSSTNGLLKAGDYLQLGSGSTARLYKVLKTVNSDGAGKATLDIWPRLRESPADGAAIITSNPVGLFRLASNETQWDIDAASFYGFGFSAIEAI